ncbi:hypothetical protein LTR64_002914 [Lithohypha guttulata]|uniref:uncharacterized protein n=1 Tax=Lithohypha guttulata TaxID=1690604 RepID=UPI002DE1CA7E|nr:hypothetical protein LTR51_000860 [Lithohypha guttulata]
MLQNADVLPSSFSASIAPKNSPSCLAGIKIYRQAQEEYSLIKKAHRTLAPTGCTPDFCQSGRMTRILEPRVGRDRPLAEIQQEAADFLRECRDENIIESDDVLDRRIKTALIQIMETSEKMVVTDRDGNQIEGIAGGIWTQSRQELEYGLRAAWRNSRRCIMRSEHMHLALCDLRHVTSSREMASTMLDGMVRAFNRGRILPTCFVFPPRLPGRRGPMIWNTQVLQFAGYRQTNGSVLGDPANIELTEEIIALGWKPPRDKTRWDFLPLVTMAEGDRPHIAELPVELRRTVSITHPRFKEEFEVMNLKWVLAPALSRQGFDIGGNQYTGSPFIGWFMDAEVGVRDLADSFRYNVLPEVVQTCNLSDEPQTPFEDLPEYLSLVALSRAQAELNFAVYYSFLRAHVMMIDTVTSSTKYQNYDLDRRDIVGYRLPADPYWLAPPQGSIISVWHRGGMPNYQPKPMVCRHVQDPMKAWKRELEQQKRMEESDRSKSLIGHVNSHGSIPTIRIFSCSSGVNASKMAKKLYSTLERLIADTHAEFMLEKEKPLNSLSLSDVLQDDVILIIASTTGSGEIPSNAARFVEEHTAGSMIGNAPRFSVFANGDSTYGDTYNAAAKKIQEVMTSLGCRPLLGHCFAGDTAHKNPDWDSFNRWLDNIDHLFLGNLHKVDLPTSLEKIGDKTTALRAMPFATLVRKHRPHSDGMIQATFDIGDLDYHEMDHLKLLAPNPRIEVRRALKLLHLQEDTVFNWHSENAFSFLCRFVDLARPFKTLDWYPGITTLPQTAKEQLKTLAVCDLLSQAEITWTDDLVETACKDMGSIQPRLYSVASCQRHSGHRLDDILEESAGNLVDVVVKINQTGKFSNTWLLQAPVGAKLRFGQASPDTWRLVRAQRPNAPFIAIATGSGIGPVRSVLQSRMSDLDWTSGLSSLSSVLAVGNAPNSKQSSRRSSVGSGTGGRGLPKFINHHAHLGVSNTSGSVHLFAGFKPEDEVLFDHILKPAIKAEMFGTLQLVRSNAQKIRVQDCLFTEREKLGKILQDPDCIVFVCANNNAADAAEKILSDVVGSNVKEKLGERYIEEVFRSHVE